MTLPRRQFLLLAVAVALAVTQSGCGDAGPPASVPGDARAGLSLYKYAGCAQCHALSGVSVGSGPAGGPALDGVGGRHGPAWLRAFLAGHVRHEPMEALTTREQQDVAAYLATLR